MQYRTNVENWAPAAAGVGKRRQVGVAHRVGRRVRVCAVTAPLTFECRFVGCNGRAAKTTGGKQWGGGKAWLGVGVGVVNGARGHLVCPVRYLLIPDVPPTTWPRRQFVNFRRPGQSAAEEPAWHSFRCIPAGVGINSDHSTHSDRSKGAQGCKHTKKRCDRSGHTWCKGREAGIPVPQPVVV